MERKNFALATLTMASCALPLLGLAAEPATGQAVGTTAQPSSSQMVVQQTGQWIPLGVTSVVGNNAGLSMTWFIDTVNNRVIVCKALPNLANMACLPKPLP